MMKNDGNRGCRINLQILTDLHFFNSIRLNCSTDINKKNEPSLFATVFVVLSILLHVSAYIGHLQVLRIQNVKKTAVCNTNGSVTITY
jgi:hypothetical protein